MKIKINDNQYILPKNAIEALIIKFEKVEDKRKKLISKGRIPEDFPEIKLEFKSISPELEDRLLNKIISSQIKKQLLKRGIQERTLYDVSISSKELPILENWKVLGSINKNVETDSYTMDSYYQNQPIPLQYRDADPCNCDHCGHNRKRNSTFIIENQDTNEISQVGSACMTDFVSADTMEMILLYSFALKTLRNADTEYNNTKTHYMLDKVDFLAHVNAAMELTGGFISKAKSNYSLGIIPTFSAALHKMEAYQFSNYVQGLKMNEYSKLEIDKYVDFVKKIEPTEKDYTAVNDVIQWYKDHPPTDKDDERYFNTHSVLTNQSAILFDREPASVCYAIQFIKNIEIKKELERVNAEKLANKLDIPILWGEEGNKISNIELQVKHIKVGENDFGSYTSIYFESRDGRTFNWKASGYTLPDALYNIPDVPDLSTFVEYLIASKSKGEEIWLQLKGSVQHNSYTTDDGKLIENTKLSRVSSTSEVTSHPVTNGIPFLNEKFVVKEFKIEDIKEGLSVNTGEKQFQYLLTDLNENKYSFISYEKLSNIHTGDFFQTPMQFAGSEVIGFDPKRVLKVPEFSHDLSGDLLTVKKAEKLLISYDLEQKPDIASEVPSPKSNKRKPK